MRRLMRWLRLAEYGADEMALAAIACAALAYALSLAQPWLALIAALPFGIVVWFFRDPERRGPEGENLLLSPADGTVTDIVEVDEPQYIGGKALRIGIFLSPLNVHVNRAPCAGVVRWVKYAPGEFLPAYNPRAPERNESVALGLETSAGLRLVVKQITGILARRVICAAHPGEQLARGQRYGMIKFGSRTELYVPLQMVGERNVAVGDKVKGGLTPCCRVTSNEC
jgi:phosphatidylserine decarboxylase